MLLFTFRSFFISFFYHWRITPLKVAEHKFNFKIIKSFLKNPFTVTNHWPPAPDLYCLANSVWRYNCFHWKQLLRQTWWIRITNWDSCKVKPDWPESPSKSRKSFIQLGACSLIDNTKNAFRATRQNISKKPDPRRCFLKILKKKWIKLRGKCFWTNFGP